MDNMMGTPLGGLDEAWEAVSSHFEVRRRRRRKMRRGMIC